jgi:hypothetical protein
MTKINRRKAPMVVSLADHPVRFWTPEHQADGVAMVVQAVTDDGRAVNIPLTVEQAASFLTVVSSAVVRISGK